VRKVGDVMARPSEPGGAGEAQRGLDAAARAELDALRRRAFGPSPDIAGDAAALARLVELEDLALPAPPAIGERAAGSAEAVPAGEWADDGAARRPATLQSEPQPARVVTPPDSDDDALEPRSPRRRQVGMVAGIAVFVALIGVVVGLQAQRESAGSPARPLTADSPTPAIASAPDGDALIRLLINSSGDYVDLSSSQEAPVFPVDGEMTWVQPLGEYYGWAMWIAGASTASGDVNCLLLDGGSGTRSRCLSQELRAQGALLVSLPYAQIAPEERPRGMTADQSVGFWWESDGYVTVMLTPTEPG